MTPQASIETATRIFAFNLNKAMPAKRRKNMHPVWGFVAGLVLAAVLVGFAR